jgi:hypothetical protein
MQGGSTISFSFSGTSLSVPISSHCCTACNAQIVAVTLVHVMPREHTKEWHIEEVI